MVGAASLRRMRVPRGRRVPPHGRARRHARSAALSTGLVGHVPNDMSRVPARPPARAPWGPPACVPTAAFRPPPGGPGGPRSSQHPTASRTKYPDPLFAETRTRRSTETTPALRREGAGPSRERAAGRARGTSVRPAARACASGHVLSAERQASDPLLTAVPCTRSGKGSGGHLQRDVGDEGARIREAWPPDPFPDRPRGSTGNKPSRARNPIPRESTRGPVRSDRASEITARRGDYFLPSMMLPFSS